MTAPDGYWLPDDIAAFQRTLDRSSFIESVQADIDALPVADPWEYPA